MLEERTVRNKLNTYAELGILQRRKGKRNQDFYALARNEVDLTTWKAAIEFFSEVSPPGVVGSYLLVLQAKTLWTISSQRFFQDKKASTDYN